MKAKIVNKAQAQPVVRRCSGCGNIIKAQDGRFYMKYGIYCITCAENRGAFDRFQSDDAV